MRKLSVILFGLLSLALSATNVTSSLPLSLSDWKLDNGPKLIGAVGKIKGVENGKIVLSADFPQVGGYVAAALRSPQLPPDATQLEFTVTALTKCDAAIRIEDSQKRFVQTERVVMNAGEVRTLIARLDSTQWEKRWGGAGVGHIPTAPYRVIQINAIRPNDGGSTSSVQLRIDEVRVVAPPSSRFDSATDLSIWSAHHGTEFPGAAATLIIDHNGKVTLAGRFGGKSVYVAGEFHKPLPEGTKRIEFVVTADTPSEAAIRIRDRNKRYFQSKRVLLKPGVKTTVGASLDHVVWESKWGGKDLKDAVPEQPFDSLGLNLIRVNNAPAAQIHIDEVRIFGPEALLINEFALNHPVRLLVPDSSEIPRLIFHNIGRKNLVLNGVVTLINEYSGETLASPCNIAIAAGESHELLLEMDREKQGVWFATYALTDQASGRTFTGRERFAVMHPAGQTEGVAKGFLFGVCGHPYNYQPHDREREALAASLCGAKVLRTDARWERHLERAQGNWDFSWLDHTVEANAQYGIELQLILSYAPYWSWAKDWKSFSSDPKREKRGGRPDYEHWRNFVDKTSAHYKGKIRFYEVWNEPDLDHFANFPPGEYLKMQESAYRAVKSNDPQAMVMNGGLAGIAHNHSQRRKGFIDQILDSDTIDIFAFHAHGDFAVYQPQIEYITEKLKTHRLPWYSNETAISATAVGEIRQAEILFKKFIYAWSKGAIGYNWYDLRNDGFSLKNGEHNFGLITQDFKPKAAYLAYNTLATYFREAEYKNTLLNTGGLHACLFRAKDDSMLLAFWNDALISTDRLIGLSGITGQAELIDLMGNRKTLTANNGNLIVKFAQPMILRLTGQAAEPTHCGGIFPQPALMVRPGKRDRIAIKLVNPVDIPLNIQIDGVLPEGVSGTIRENCLLLPGKHKDIEFLINVSPEFRSYESMPRTVSFLLKSQEFEPIECSFPILSEIGIPADTFPSEPTFLLNAAHQVVAQITNEPQNAHLHWQGPQDLSAEIRLVHRNGELLLQAIVSDDIHVQKKRGGDVWMGDNIQFALQLPNQDSFWEIGLTRLDNGAPEVFIWRAPSGYDATAVAGKIKLKTRRDEQSGQTVYNASIPFDALGFTEQIGKEGFRFNLIVNDNDGKLRESYIMIAPGIGSGKETSKYPKVRFHL